MNKIGNLWSVKFTQSGKEKELKAKKAIVSTGSTSHPNIPKLKGKDEFKASFFHDVDF